jgi:hypothetical protein
MVPEKPRIVVVWQFQASKWRRIVNVSRGLERRLMQNSQKLWKRLLRLVLRLQRHIPRPPMGHILLLLRDPTLAVPSDTYHSSDNRFLESCECDVRSRRVVVIFDKNKCFQNSMIASQLLSYALYYYCHSINSDYTYLYR